MKRGAERQIQREDGDDPYAVDGDSSGGGSTGMEGEVSDRRVGQLLVYFVN